MNDNLKLRFLRDIPNDAPDGGVGTRHVKLLSVSRRVHGVQCVGARG
jgi:hypothetical protein